MTLPIVIALLGVLASDTRDVVVPQRFDDTPTALRPLRPLTERRRDLRAANAHYAMGRLLARRGQLDDALRQYQRSFRLNPEGVAAIETVVPLAVELRRIGVAARYAVLAPDEADIDPGILHRLALYWTQVGGNDEALRLYTRLERALPNAERDSAFVFRHFEMARLYFLDQQYDLSATSYEIVREALDNPQRFGLDDAVHKLLLGDVAVTYTAMAESFLRAGRVDGARALFRKAASFGAPPQLTPFQLARIAEREEKFSEARDLLDQYLRAKSTEGGLEPYALFERLVRQSGADTAETTRLLEQLHQNDPANPSLAHYLAQWYDRQGNVDRSRQLLEIVIRRAPTASAVQQLLAYYLEAKAHDQLLPLLTLVFTQTGDLESLGDVGSRLHQDREAIDNLIASATKSRAEKRLDVASALTLATTLLGAGRVEEARACFMHAIPLLGADQRPLRQLEWGRQLLVHNRPAEAAMVLQELIDSRPDQEMLSLGSFYLATAQDLNGKLADALSAIESALQANSQAVLMRSRHAWLLYRAQRWDEASREYLQLLREFDGNHESDEIREMLKDVRSSLSSIAVSQGRLDESETWLEEILDEFPNDVGALNDLGYLWADRHQHLERALRMVTAAVAQEPDNAAYRDSLGWALFRLGRIDDALRELRRATSGDAPDGLILEHLGDVLYHAGQHDAARTTWKQAIEQFRGSADTPRIEAVEAKIARQNKE